MGTVIAWPGPSATAGRRRLDDNEPRGQILFFTGVRYERHEERPTGAGPSSTSSGAQRGRRKRA